MNTDFLQTDLFRVPEPENGLKHALGNNEQGVILIARTQPKTHEQEIELLEKILSAVKLDIKKDTLLFNVTNQELISFSQIIRNRTVNQAFFFGFTPPDLGLHLKIPKYHPLKFRGVWICFSDPLHELLQNKTLKAALWQALQQIFK